jgi:hypothetical protein
MLVACCNNGLGRQRPPRYLVQIRPCWVAGWNKLGANAPRPRHGWLGQTHLATLRIPTIQKHTPNTLAKEKHCANEHNNIHVAGRRLGSHHEHPTPAAIHAPKQGEMTPHHNRGGGILKKVRLCADIVEGSFVLRLGWETHAFLFILFWNPFICMQRTTTEIRLLAGLMEVSFFWTNNSLAVC